MSAWFLDKTHNGTFELHFWIALTLNVINKLLDIFHKPVAINPFLVAHFISLVSHPFKTHFYVIFSSLFLISYSLFSILCNSFEHQVLTIQLVVFFYIQIFNIFCNKSFSKYGKYFRKRIVNSAFKNLISSEIFMWREMLIWP